MAGESDLEMDEALLRLAEAEGVSSEYYDMWGNLHQVAPMSLAAVLGAMGHDVSDPAAALARMEREERVRFIPPVTVASVNAQPSEIPLCFPMDPGAEERVRIKVTVSGADGQIEERSVKGVMPVSVESVDGTVYARVMVTNEARREIGYYQVAARCTTVLKGRVKTISGTMRLVVAPDACYQGGGRSWGISANLYSMKSAANWGIGDLGDLGALADWARDTLHAGFVGINPLHVSSNRAPEGVSPYYPISRLFMNPVYADMSDLPGYTVDAAAIAGEIAPLRESLLIDYEGVHALKRKVLMKAFDEFMGNNFAAGKPTTVEAAELVGFIEREGRALDDFAYYMVIDEHQGSPKEGWRSWPKKYQSPDSVSTRKFLKDKKREVMFHKYVQWILARQLAHIRGRMQGMKLGLYGDLAVGSIAGGSDTWGYKGFAIGVSVGAPPDNFSPQGQDWGFPPMSPRLMRASGYELFIRTLGKAMAEASALRIDHALGLFRLFWVPEGMGPAAGTYVTYPHEDLLRIIALESALNHCVVIAEDLGTIGENVREALQGFGMLSYRLLYFERDWESGRFLNPDEYPEMAMCAVNTHDLPTLEGFWAARDVMIRRELGILSDEETWRHELSVRLGEKGRMLEALAPFMPEGTSAHGAEALPAVMPEIKEAIYRFLAATPCHMACISLDDLMDATEQQNLPGVLIGYPNWRRRSVKSLEELRTLDSPQKAAQAFEHSGYR